MVSLFDAGLGEFLIPVFIFLLIYAIVYAVLKRVGIFGDSMNVNAIVAFVLASLFAITPGAMEFVSVIAPWFIVMVLVAFSIMLVFMFGGYKMDTIENIFRDATVYWTILIFSIIILVAGLTAVYGPFFLGGGPSTGEGGAGGIHSTIFNAKVLTTVVMLIIFAFAIRLLSFEAERPS
jgi:hypothetical protein